MEWKEIALMGTQEGQCTLIKKRVCPRTSTMLKR